MRSPVPSRRILVGENVSRCSLFGGPVGEAALPGVPDQVEPCSSQNAGGMVVSTYAGAVVEAGCPGAGVAGVGGEDADAVTELSVAGLAASDGTQFQFSGLAGEHPRRQASRAATWRHPGYISVLSKNAATRQVDQ